ncbi:MAG: hypothetical protein MUF36_10515 [Bacteroidales bacterium]|jgi:hypothetical protein|nr:hypothetical protein [Bacteroidales bacterium]
MQNRAAKILSAILIFIPLYSSGQKSVNSPLARFNLGIIEPAGSFRSLGMGGTGVAIRDNLNIYYLNPASYSSLDTNSFVFDFGIDYGVNIVTDGTNDDLSEDLNFDHFMIGFPISKRWGIAAGLVPVSNGYYNIAEHLIEEDPIGEYSSYHGGSGGFTNFFLGTGLNITKNLSAGVNMSLLFGSIKRFNEFIFTDYAYTFQTNMTEKLQMTGIGIDAGLQYSTSLKNDYFLNIGASYNTGKHCKSIFESMAYRYNIYSSADTLPGFPIYDSTKAQLPGTLRAGLAFGKKNKFTLSLDYVYTNWANARITGSEGYLTNTHTFLLGAEYTPDRLSNYSYLKRIDYRIGGHIGNNYLLLNGYKVNELGASIGAGLPMKRRYASPAAFYSKFNFYIDYTRKSMTGAPFVHDENYFTIGLSLNLYDNWFFKRKYD